MEEQEFWKKCSFCKEEIGFNSKYYLCSASACRVKRLGLVFCSPACWDGHVAIVRHRDAYADEKTSPSKAAYLEELRAEAEPSKPAAPVPKAAPVSPAQPTPPPKTAAQETLVVVSKVKGLIRDRSSFNTSQDAIDALTRVVSRECEKAIVKATNSGRKTVMGRDFD